MNYNDAIKFLTELDNYIIDNRLKFYLIEPDDENPKELNLALFPTMSLFPSKPENMLLRTYLLTPAEAKLFSKELEKLGYKLTLKKCPED